MTNRLPFDPSKMNRKDRALGTSPARGLSVGALSGTSSSPLTVAQLASRIESSVKDSFPSRICLIAEVSSVTHRTHYYFHLKDDKAVLSAVLFASAARKQRALPVHGQQVIVHGKLDYYAPSGRISFIVDKLEPAGQGDLEQRYKALCDDLRARGWFDPLSKRPLPIFPRTLAIITSSTGAALQDVLDTAAKRCPAVGMKVIDVRVQGDQAKTQIAHALNKVSACHESLGIDAIILTRGGGSLEDLWAFNEPVVARAIHECPVPIVAAIGHETDTTVAELVADERAATPTQAAMKLVPDRAALGEQLDSLGRRLQRELTSTLVHHSNRLGRLAGAGPLANPARLIEPSAAKLPVLIHRLDGAMTNVHFRVSKELEALALRLAKHQPAAVHAARQENIAGLSRRLGTAMRTRISVLNARMSTIDRELNAIGPRQVLARGYSLTTANDGSLIRSSKTLKAGDPITTHLSDGQVHSTVIGKNKIKPKNPKPSSDSEPSLFQKD